MTPGRLLGRGLQRCAGGGGGSGLDDADQQKTFTPIERKILNTEVAEAVAVWHV
jgi:hypothetical protein